MQMLLSFLLSSILLSFTPGPDLIMVFNKAIEKGFKHAFLFILGLMTGLVGHTLILVFGWAQFIGERPEIVQYMQLIGFFYFVFIGLKTLFNFKRGQKENKAGLVGKKSYLQGLMMNLLNPKVSLFFWLFFPGFLFSTAIPIYQQYLFLGFVFILQAFLVFSLVAFFATHFSIYLKHKKGALFSGVLWIVLGIYLLLQ